MSFQPQMKAAHAAVFQGAAKLYGVYILVRRTNLRSLDHVGDAHCTPKPLDCKAKTADQDYVHPRFGPKQVAGLVVDPTITGRAAFRTDAKYQSACTEWRKMAAELHPGAGTFEAQQRLVWLVHDGRTWRYFVDLDPMSPRTGCVKLTPTGLRSAAKYIHGDFDLYGIVPAADPARNVAVTEKRLGQTHARSPEFVDVQNYVNSRIGAPMVLHGAQESYGAEHSDEGIDVFHPDGTITGCENAAEIARLYETTFQGRKLFTRDGPRDIVRGRFVTPG